MATLGKNRRGFSLIELLVVIAIIAVLMAILMPTLQRVRKQTKSVVCQSNLRQWGAYWATSIAEYDGQFPHPDPSNKEAWDRWGKYWGGWGGWGWGPYWGWGNWYGYNAHYSQTGYHHYQDPTKGIRCCPMATKRAIRKPGGGGGSEDMGGTFKAWGWISQNQSMRIHDVYGSYGSNPWAGVPHPDWDEHYRDFLWRTPDVRGANNIPLQMDSCYPAACLGDAHTPPPECDAIPDARVQEYWGGGYCINRHDGFINAVFMDFSVRKVGLKELWTLKWHREFDTAGPWTKAGKAKPEDWPQWLRSFKDY